jgi:adenosylcobyric acid synthase
VIASIVGTHALLAEDEKALLRGYVVNRFRGDVSLFDDAIGMIAERTGLRCFGVIPYLAEARALPAEDSLALGTPESGIPGGGIRIAVPQLLHIANFDDLDPLKAEPDVAVTMVPPGEALPGDADLVILAGTKATIPALEHFRAQGWDIDLAAHIRRGGHVLGICGGYQMLGRTVSDSDGLEGAPGRSDGLGLLDVDTVIEGRKTLARVAGEGHYAPGPVTGYEMHMGRTSGPGTREPFLIVGGRPEGAVGADGRVTGSYVHGLFSSDAFRHGFLSRVRTRGSGLDDFTAHVERALDAVAQHLEEALDIDALLAAASRPER